jgi:hypothetical protein
MVSVFCAFRENRRREGCTFLTGVDESTFPRVT